MNIGDNSYNMNIRTSSPSVGNQNQTQGQSPVQAGQTVQGAVSNAELSGNAQISQVPEGQLFHGQILNVTNNEVNIMLDNSKTLLAHMSEAMNLNIGDSLTFMIKENDGANVVIRPFMEQPGVMKDNAIFKALEVNNFSPTEKNYQIAETLMRQNMPLDRAGMQRIMQQSYHYPATSIDTLVSMNKLGIPVNDANIAQFEEYLANTHQLAGDVENISAGIAEFSSEVLNSMASGSGQTGVTDMLAFNDVLLGILSDAEDMANIGQNLQGIADGQEGMLQTNAEAIQQGLADGMPQTLSEMSREAAGVQQNTGEISEQNQMNQDMKAVMDSLSSLGVSNERIAELKEESKTPLQMLNNINRLLSETEINKEQLAGLLASDGYKGVLKEAVKRKFTLDGDNMKEPGEVDELYKSIYDKTSKLMDAFSDTGGKAGGQLQEQAKGMQERLDFIQNLNQMYAYAQIPVRLSNREMNSELFVYMNKRNMKNPKEDVSALLHLDMDYLGPTDVHVSLSGGVVHTRFYVEDEVSARIIDEHMTMLEKAVNDSGYSLTNEVITREPTLGNATNMVVKDMLGQDMEKSVKRYSFDVRT